MTRFEEAYPTPLKDQEAGLVAARRAANGLDAKAPAVGIALSGGGIRSATFCLGVFQALARFGLIGRFDYMSTVSGGGYFGSFLGGLFMRGDGKRAASVETTLADPCSWPVRWLRENGRYMSPNGAGDTWLAAAVLLRNWTAVHVVAIAFVAMWISAAALIRVVLCGFEWHRRLESSLAHSEGFWWSPSILLPALPMAIAVVMGSVYWLTQVRPIVATAQAAMGALLSKWRDLPTAEFLTRGRNALSRMLATSLLLALILFAFALLDSLGQTIYRAWASRGFGFPWAWSGGAAVWIAVFGVAQKLFVVLDALPRRKSGPRIPFDLLALLAALAWTGLLTLSVSVATHGFVWGWSEPTAGEVPPVTGILIVALATSIASFVFSRSFGFVNLSSQQQLYGSRLKRAYLGASNPARREAHNSNVTEPLPGDDVEFPEYRPHDRGGPLHLINVTVNETVSGKSQIEQRDRKGLPLAVGPCGLTVGMDHALWSETREKVQPIERGPGRFHALGADCGKGVVMEPHVVERLGLANWIAVSGAAFTTGLGAGTKLGLSLLLGLANVRLGYWWDSGVDPKARASRTPPRPAARVAERFGALFPVQTCMLDEFLARFHGPARKYWYLSDGGHFENTACYELIRRRVPFIVASDAGRDTRTDWTDVANLVRKARTDFGAEIELLRRRRNGAAGLALEDLLHPELLEVIGEPEDFVAAAAAPGAAPEDRAGARRHALLARVVYADPPQVGYILLLKPSLTGDEPPDLLQYRSAHPDFPQESTMDQFFDEAQWESYRKLGEHIATLVFALPKVKDKDGRWAPREMRPPG